MTMTGIVGVVGLGTMGLGIAQVFAQAGLSVLATDQSEAARTTARARLAATLDERVKSGKLAAADRDATLANLTIVAQPEDLRPSHLVVEAIIETLAAKCELFTHVEAAVAQHTVLATNTSSLSVAAIAAPLRHPQRLVGLHFFNPAPVMKLVELVAHPTTSPAALATARRLAEGAGKIVVACPDRPGFIVNRCARPFYGEALALLEEGRQPQHIDAALIAAGYRLGPFSLIDLIGADINLAATQSLAQAMANHPRYHVFTALEQQVAKGDLGRKTGRGFIVPAAVGQPPADAAALALRIEATLVNEACYLLGEGGVSEAGIDTALKLGLNFPRGPFESARLHGVPRIRTTLLDLEAAAPSHLKGRYVPAPLLETLA